MNQEINYIEQVANLLHKNNSASFKQLLNNPKPLKKITFLNKVLPNINEYFITEKSDGERCLLFIRQNSIFYITGSTVTPIKINSSSQFNKIANSVFDCELINGETYIFDIIEFTSRNISKDPFEKRWSILQDIKPHINETSNNTKIHIKNIHKLTNANYQQKILDVYKHQSKKLKYEIDGIIFIQGGKNYNNTLNLKWKPPHLLTIDFLAIENGDSIILTNGINQYLQDVYKLQLTEIMQRLSKPFIIDDNYKPVPFCNSLKPNLFIVEKKNLLYSDANKIELGKNRLNGTIIELSYDLKDDKWILHRTRDDRILELKSGKYYGNNFKVAEDTFVSIINPLTFKDLTAKSVEHLQKNMYFQKQDDSYKYVKSFNNFVKSELIKKEANRKFIIELGIGRGGDLKKYIDNKIEYVLGIENDLDAIEELMERKHRIFKNDGLILNIVHADLTSSYIKVNNKIYESYSGVEKYIEYPPIHSIKANAIFCSFAFHYFVENAAASNNIISFIDHWLNEGCKLYITTFDGQKVFDFLKEKKWKWKTEKYMIEYIGKPPDKFNGFGHKIKTRLPFSNKIMEEYLVDFDNIEKIFKRKGISIHNSGSFLDFMAEYNMKFGENNKQKNIIPSDDDLDFIGLYKFVIFTKSN